MARVGGHQTRSTRPLLQTHHQALASPSDLCTLTFSKEGKMRGEEAEQSPGLHEDSFKPNRSGWSTWKETEAGFPV